MYFSSHQTPWTSSFSRLLRYGTPGERRVLYDRNGTGYLRSPAEVEWDRLVRLTVDCECIVPVGASTTEEETEARGYILEKVESILAEGLTV